MDQFFQKELDFSVDWEKELEAAGRQAPPRKSWDDFYAEMLRRQASPKFRILRAGQIKKAAAVYRFATQFASETFSKATVSVSGQGVFQIAVRPGVPVLHLMQGLPDQSALLGAILYCDQMDLWGAGRDGLEIAFLVNLCEECPLTE